MIVLDANVLVDYLDVSRECNQDAVELVEVAHKARINLAAPLSVLPTVFYILRRTRRQKMLEWGESSESAGVRAREEAWKMVVALSRIFRLLPIQSNDVDGAVTLREYHNDFEDNLVLAAAIRAGASVLVTSDKNLMAHSPIKAVEPKEAVRLIGAGALRR